MNKEEYEKCKKAFIKWNGEAPESESDLILFEGWVGCYSWLLNNKKRAFDEMLDEMYNSYKQENFGGKDEP